MPKQETRTLYTLAELEKEHPEAYERVRERWVNDCATSAHIPWSDEIIDSLKATVEACGGVMRRWSIGPYSYSNLEVVADDDYYPDDSDDPSSVDHGWVRKDSAWLYAEILRPMGYAPCPERGVAFPGLCPLTGVCFDECMLEAVYQAMQRGESLTEALEGLADLACKMMEAEIEHDQSEDVMSDMLADRWFTEDGDEA